MSKGWSPCFAVFALVTLLCFVRVLLFICAFSLLSSTFRFCLPPFARFSGDPNYGMSDQIMHFRFR